MSAVVKLLKIVHPDGPWHLSTSHTGGEFKTVEEAEAFVAKMGAGNVRFRMTSSKGGRCLWLEFEGDLNTALEGFADLGPRPLSLGEVHLLLFPVSQPMSHEQIEESNRKLVEMAQGMGLRPVPNSGLRDRGYALPGREIAAAPVLADLPFSDLGNSRRLVAATGGLYRYSYAAKRWLVYSDGRWAEDAGAAVMRLCKQTALGIAAEPGEPQKVFAWAAKSQSRDRLKAMEELARAELPVTVDELDSDHWLLNLRNGTLDLRSGAFRPHDAADMLTKQAAVDFVEGADCPLFRQFVSQIMRGDQEAVAFLQRAAGYSLTGDTREHAFFVLYGGGANGKSTLLRVLTALLGTYAHTAQMAAFVQSHQQSEGANESLASMRGARIVMASEISNGAALNEQLVKNMTGGDRVRARFLHQNSFEFTPTFKVWLVVNHLPRISGTDHGIWRRVRIVPFLRQFKAEEQDKTLADRIIAEELPGVLNWLVQGCLAWQREGLGGAAVVAAATKVYRQKSDIIMQWFEDRCQLGPNWVVPVARARADFKEWCISNGERVLGKQEFTSALYSHGYEAGRQRKIEGKNHRCYHGFKLRDMPAAQAVAEADAAQEEQLDAPF